MWETFANVVISCRIAISSNMYFSPLTWKMGSRLVFFLTPERRLRVRIGRGRLRRFR